MAMSLESLAGALKTEQYAARTDEALQKEAETRVTENYDAMRNTAKQRQAAIDEAYGRELQSLADTLATGQNAVAQEVARANAGIDDYINTRSVQRTSYGAAAKGSIQANLQKAAQQMTQQYETARGGVENSRVLLAQQLAGTLAQYDKDYLTDVQAYIDQQKQLDYDRKIASDAEYNALLMSLFEMGKTGSSGGGGYRRSSGSGSSPTSNGGNTGLFEEIASAPANYSGSYWESPSGKVYNKTTNTKGDSTHYTSPSGKTYAKT